MLGFSSPQSREDREANLPFSKSGKMILDGKGWLHSWHRSRGTTRYRRITEYRTFPWRDPHSENPQLLLSRVRRLEILVGWTDTRAKLWTNCSLSKGNTGLILWSWHSTKPFVESDSATKAKLWPTRNVSSYGQKSAPFQFSDAERRSISGSPLLFPRDLRAWCAYLMTDLTDGTLRRGWHLLNHQQ